MCVFAWTKAEVDELAAGQLENGQTVEVEVAETAAAEVAAAADGAVVAAAAENAVVAEYREAAGQQTATGHEAMVAMVVEVLWNQAALMDLEAPDDGDSLIQELLAGVASKKKAAVQISATHRVLVVCTIPIAVAGVVWQSRPVSVFAAGKRIVAVALGKLTAALGKWAADAAGKWTAAAGKQTVAAGKWTASPAAAHPQRIPWTFRVDFPNVGIAALVFQGTPQIESAMDVAGLP